MVGVVLLITLSIVQVLVQRSQPKVEVLIDGPFDGRSGGHLLRCYECQIRFHVSARGYESSIACGLVFL